MLSSWILYRFYIESIYKRESEGEEQGGYSRITTRFERERKRDRVRGKGAGWPLQESIWTLCRLDIEAISEREREKERERSRVAIPPSLLDLREKSHYKPKAPLEAQALEVCV